MPKLSYRVLKYAHHKASGQAVVRINGKLVYLGPRGSKEPKNRIDSNASERPGNCTRA